MYRWLLHHCEHLVQKRLCQKLLLTRLPTGHTHEDIDAIFAIIWKYFIRFHTIDTFSQFKTGLESAFKSDSSTRSLQCIVYDLLVCIPDYKPFYADYLDAHLSDYTKQESTMHQWKFEVMEVSKWFPTGVKTCYKAYSSDRVVVFEKKNKDECLSDIGCATGLEPTTLCCPWHPLPYEDPARPGIEGFYLLKSVPHSPTLSLPPMELVEDAYLELRRTLQSINSEYNAISDSWIREEWNKWFDQFCPRSNSALEYLDQLKAQKLAWHIPLKDILLNKDVFIVTPDWLYRHELKGRPTNSSLFEWPEILAAAMHSVQTDMNLHPYPGRLYSPTNTQLIEERNTFKETVRGPYYEGHLRGHAMTNVKLYGILRQKVGYTGVVPSNPGYIKKYFPIIYYYFIS